MKTQLHTTFVELKQWLGELGYDLVKETGKPRGFWVKGYGQDLFYRHLAEVYEFYSIKVTEKSS